MNMIGKMEKLHSEAKNLVAQLVSGYHEKFGVGTMSCAVYDTAWVAMVEKTIDEKRQWLFPESFQYLLNTQMETGGWQSYAAQVDGILNTLGGLLALQKHLKNPELSSQPLPENLETRINNATTFVTKLLNEWDVAATTHVGFEILVPAMLNYLEKEGINIEFKSKPLLMAINQKKMSRFHPKILYTPMKISAVHSLEAFIGQIDFDKVIHHKTFGSMMASPSSTAAYLLNASKWDDDSEEYLRHVLAHAAGKGSGGVPSAFPSTYFEYTWIVCTLMKGGFTKEQLGLEQLDQIANTLEAALNAEKGVIGFAPFVGADADDTAFAITTLNLLGRPTQAEALIKEFEAPTHFRTYSLERNPSLSANCNVLNALLHVPSPNTNIKQIEKCTKFLCEEWWHADGPLEDKWNLTSQYPTMLLVQSLLKLVQIWEQGDLPDLDVQLLTDRVIIALYQALVRTLQTQQEAGSWGKGFEATAYAVITLANLASLPFADIIRPQIDLAIENGRKHLNTRPADNPLEHLWIEKVTYGSPYLAEAYILNALNISTPTYSFGEKVSGLATVHSKAVMKFSQFWGQIPMYHGTPKWQLQASIVEAYLYLPMLKKRRLDVFPRQDMEEDKYLEYIPITWTTANNREGTFLSSYYIWEMIALSLLTYQADEYMEAVVGKYYGEERDLVVGMIDHIFASLGKEEIAEPTVKESLPEQMDQNTKAGTESVIAEPVAAETHESAIKSEQQASKPTEATETLDIQPEAIPLPNELDTEADNLSVKSIDHSEASDIHSGSTDSGYNTAEASMIQETKPEPEPQIPERPSLEEVGGPIRKFLTHILLHPKVLGSSQLDQIRLKRELRIYLLAHLTQTEDNLRYGSQALPADKSVAFETAATSYFSWVQSTSADHTSCPCAFAFVNCLLSKDGKDCFKSAEEKYVAEDLCRHLAVTCRQYNDYGSVSRDRDEKNVNSINFPEFFWKGESTTDQSLKDELYAVALYEKQKLDIAVAELERLCGKDGRARLAEAIKMFVNLTDTYGQIYILRDIASRMH